MEIEAHMAEFPANKPGRFQAWVLAARPKTLPAASAPVVLGTFLALADGTFRWGPALAALTGALLLQIGANLANDVFDFHRGADTEQRMGPMRATASGWLTPRQMLTGMSVVFGLALLIGVYLTWQAGWWVAVAGLLAIAAAIAYTGGPYPLGYNGLGELAVFIFFGLVAVCGTYYVQAQTVSLLSGLAAIPMGLLCSNILVVNNLRDIDTDRLAGKRTLAARFGAEWARREYLTFLVGSYLTPLILALLHLAPWTALLAWLSLPLAYRLVQQVWKAQGRALNRTLAGSGQLQLVFAVLFGLGLLFK
jgi:1,4-dihydroxy-2-naphthoate octaprenyltransferase